MVKVSSNMRLFIVIFAVLISLKAAAANAEPVCNLTDQSDIQTTFEAFYSSSTSPKAYSDLKVNNEILLFDCGYFFIVETMPKQQVFGAEHAYFFSNYNHEFLGSLTRE